MLKNIFISCVFILTIVTNTYATENNKKIDIKYGYPDQSIFVATINGKEQPTTPMLFVANELFERADLTWRATAYPAKRLFRNFKDGTTNFSILVRASSLLDSCLFSKKPVYSTNLNVYHIGDKQPILKEEDLVGKRIATIRGYSYGKLRKFIGDPKNKIANEVVNTHSGAFRMLKLGRVDYVLDYASAAKDIITENAISDIKSNMLSELKIYLVLSKAYPNAEELMGRLEGIMDGIDVNAIVKRSGVKTAEDL